MIATSDTAAGGIAPDAVAVGQGFRLAHLSDLHLASPLALSVGDMFSKRLVGYLSWQLRRRRIHRADVLRVLTEDLRGEGADHIVVTGDIVNISLVREFQAAATWLASLGPADRISVIPGNHDAYVRIGWEGSLAAWRPYMLSDGPPPGEGDEPNGGGRGSRSPPPRTDRRHWPQQRHSLRAGLRLGPTGRSTAGNGRIDAALARSARCLSRRPRPSPTGGSPRRRTEAAFGRRCVRRDAGPRRMRTGIARP